MITPFSRSLYALIALNCLSIAASESDVKTVFYQGMNNTLTQAARLVGKEGFIYPYTAEVVYRDSR